MQTEPRLFDFTAQRLWSDGYLDGGIARILRARIPGCYDVVKATDAEDRSGTDYWALRNQLPELSIDVKVRSKDYAAHPDPLKQADDLALETFSVLDPPSRIGWTRDVLKRTDYVLWYWTDTTRFFLVSFPALCRVFRRYWQEWRLEYRTEIQCSNGWRSQCVFVPRSVVVQKINDWQNGLVTRRTP